MTTSAAVFRSLREAFVTMLAAVLTLLCTLAFAPSPGPAVLAVVLCLALSRSQLDRDARGRVEAALALPAVGLVAAGIGYLLHNVPWLGAAVFIAGLFISIWLRRFGAMAARAGSLIALPFVALLVTPYIPGGIDSPIATPLIPVVVALLALLWVTVLHALARGVRLLPTRREDGSGPLLSTPAPATQKSESALRPIASTRMAIQMAVALAVSFAAGYAWFADRWTWIVLTAFIVLSGNRGRLDVAYKSVLRVTGAAAGTVIAIWFSTYIGSHDNTTVPLILAAIFMGVWLRPLGYAWWALFVTLALALLQGFAGASGGFVLWLRLEEIVIGAFIGIVTAWFVLPVRSTSVMRLRIANALVALSEALDPATPERTPDAFIAAMERVEEIAPAFRASRMVTKRFVVVQPADWVDVLRDCRGPAVELIEKGVTPEVVRNAVGGTRKAVREPAEILGALQELRGTFSKSTLSPRSEVAL